MNRCTIFAGGEPVAHENVDYKFVEGSYVISADKGYLLAESLGVCSDLIIGDFDSLGEIPQSDNVEVFPIRKDDTDLMLALKAGLSRGKDNFIIYGATGGRLDHTVGNIQSLKFLLDNGAFGKIISDRETVMLLTSGKYSFEGRENYSLSLFSYSEKVEGLSISGAKYSLQNGTLSNGFPLGISNFVPEDCVAEIEFSKGILLVIQSFLK